MDEIISRRMAITGLATFLAAAGAGHAFAVTPPEPDTQGDLRKLGEISVLLAVAGNHLTRFQAGFVSPPEPDRPAFVDALTQIQSECQNVMDIAAELLKLVA